MIRDEFKNADKEVIKKKSNKKMLQMGERAYYAKKLSTINEMFKPVKASSIFCTVCFGLLAIVYLVAVIFVKDYKLSGGGIAIIAITAACIIWCFTWFVFLVPYYKKKALHYKEELMKMNREYVEKMSQGRR